MTQEPEHTPDETPAAEPPATNKRRSRPALAGGLLFLGLLLLCFAFALLLLAQDPDESSEEGPRIGVLEISGVLTSSRGALETLRAYRKSEKIKAVVVRLNTPGGAVGPAQEIFREIQRTRKSKPVVASMGTLAASAGYYIAAACQEIIANPGTLTGSIGVITQTTEVSQLLALARIRANTLTSGKHKDTGSPLRAMTDEDRRVLQAVVDRIHGQFVRDVAKGRGLTVAAVTPLATGRVITGEEAKDKRLVDRLGNFSDALEAAAKLAKAEGEPVPVYRRGARSLISRILEEAGAKAATTLQRELSRRLRIEARHPGL